VSARKYKIRDVVYTIKHVKLKDRGLCSSPKADKPHIKIQKGLKGVEHMEVLIHEILHACLWDLDEEAIDESSIVIAEILNDYFEIKDRGDRGG
jgi:hypothetical protein